MKAHNPEKLRIIFLGRIINRFFHIYQNRSHTLRLLQRRFHIDKKVKLLPLLAIFIFVFLIALIDTRAKNTCIEDNLITTFVRFLCSCQNTLVEVA